MGKEVKGLSGGVRTGKAGLGGRPVSREVARGRPGGGASGCPLGSERHKPVRGGFLQPLAEPARTGRGGRGWGEPSVLEGTPKNLWRALSARGEAQEPGESPQYSRGGPKNLGRALSARGDP